MAGEESPQGCLEGHHPVQTSSGHQGRLVLPTNVAAVEVVVEHEGRQFGSTTSCTQIQGSGELSVSEGSDQDRSVGVVELMPEFGLDCLFSCSEDRVSAEVFDWVAPDSCCFCWKVVTPPKAEHDVVVDDLICIAGYC